MTEGADVVIQSMVTPAPKPGEMIVRHGSVAAKVPVPGKPGQIVSATNRWRENYNPLRGLNMRRAVELLELGQRGDYAYLQWAYRFCERRNPTLSGVVSRCEAPLMSFDWSIKVIPEAPRGMSEAEFKKKSQAQKEALEDAYNLVDNIREAIMHLHMADFRGYAHLQKHRNADGDVTHFECLDQWCICRDGLNGNWWWNPDSRSTSMPLQFLGEDYCIGGETLPLADFIIREVVRPIDEIGLVNTVRRALVEKDYDAYIEIYGVPSGVVIMPPGVPAGSETQYETSATKVAEGASGALPYGSDYKANVPPRSQDPFNPRLDNLDAQLVLAATGGKLTMLTERAAGQTRGNSRVHDETFGQIASGRAQNISELFQRCHDAEVLSRAGLLNDGEGKPLAYFSFGGEEETDVSALCTDVLTLSQAGKNVNTEFLSEKTGYQFDEDSEPQPQTEEQPNNPLPQRNTNNAKTKNRTSLGKVETVDEAAEDITKVLMPLLQKSLLEGLAAKTEEEKS